MFVSVFTLNGEPSAPPRPRPSPIWSDCDFWWADDRALDHVLGVGRGVISLASCESGLPNCIDGAVLVAKDTFMSRVEKVVEPCEKGEDKDCCCCCTDDDDDDNDDGCCDRGSSGGGED